MEKWYVYVIHESPIEKPFYCKVGYSKDPLTRLKSLQAGNPRALRAIDYSRLPHRPFGIGFQSEKDAKYIESKIHAKLREIGIGLRSDYNYQKNTSFEREWFEGMHPNDIWRMLMEESMDILLSYVN